MFGNQGDSRDDRVAHQTATACLLWMPCCARSERTDGLWQQPPAGCLYCLVACLPRGLPTLMGYCRVRCKVARGAASKDASILQTVSPHRRKEVASVQMALVGSWGWACPKAAVASKSVASADSIGSCVADVHCRIPWMAGTRLNKTGILAGARAVVCYERSHA